MILAKSLENWACSFSGCDGGDIENSKIWFSGIEWGYGKNQGQTDESHKSEMEDYYVNRLPKEISEGYCKPYSDKYRLQENISYPFGINTTKLYSAIIGDQVTNYKNNALAGTGSEIFKVNMFPIAFPTKVDSWWSHYGADKITGIPTKQGYRDWILPLRAKFFEISIQKFKPRVIVCFGVEDVDSFSQCYAGLEDSSSMIKEQICDVSIKNNSPRTLYWKNIFESTYLFVIPFPLNRSGLNSNYLLQAFGERIKEISGLNHH